MAKNDQKIAIIWQFFNFFQKILVLMPPKLLCIFWPFVPTYSQSSSHLETILGIKIFFVFFFYFLFKKKTHTNTTKRKKNSERILRGIFSTRHQRKFISGINFTAPQANSNTLGKKEMRVLPDQEFECI